MGHNYSCIVVCFACFLLVVVGVASGQAGRDAPVDHVIDVDVSAVATHLEPGALGFCVSYVTDDDRHYPDRVQNHDQAILEAGAGTLRFPMGTLGDNYLWHTPERGLPSTRRGLGIRPCVVSKELPPATWSWAVNNDGSMKANSLDFDEFMKLCQQTGSEPIIMVNAQGHLHDGARYTYADLKTSAANWVHYANIVQEYGVRYWEIGNEVDLKDGRHTHESYVALLQDFSRAMKAVDPNIFIGIGTGFNTPWFEYTLKHAAADVDFLVAHQYNSNFTTYDDYIPNRHRLIHQLEKADTAIEKHCPWEHRKRMKLLVTEFSCHSSVQRWESKVNDLGKSLVTLEMALNAFSTLERLDYMHFWVTHSPWGQQGRGDQYANAFDAQVRLLPQAVALSTFCHFQRETMLQVERVHGTLRAYAGYSATNGALTIWLLNKDRVEQTVRVNVRGVSGHPAGQRWVYAGQNYSPDDTVVALEEKGAVGLNQGSLRLALDPVSMTVVTLGETNGESL